MGARLHLSARWWGGSFAPRGAPLRLWGPSLVEVARPLLLREPIEWIELPQGPDYLAELRAIMEEQFRVAFGFKRSGQ